MKCCWKSTTQATTTSGWLTTTYLPAAIRHYRALAFERLGRPDNLLTEYAAIVRFAGVDSAWGRLAALHLAPQ